VLKSKGSKIIKNCGRSTKMIAYKVFYKNYKHKKNEFLGRLLERRKHLRGKSRIESGLKWAKWVLGPMVKDQHAIFVVPNELDSNDETRVLVEKRIN
jgi:hypothetical protein